MAKEKPLIGAKTIEEFQKIEEALKTLPEKVLDQILSVKSGMSGFDCSLRYNFCKDQNIYTPKEITTQITDFGDFIGIYAGKFFFRIEGDMYKNGKFNYIFI